MNHLPTQYPDLSKAHEAIHADRRGARRGAYIVIYRLGGRFNGPLFPSDGGDDEQRRAKIDAIEVYAPHSTARPVAGCLCSTFPFYDLNGRTKVVEPGFYPSAMAIGEHKGRPGIVNQGLTAISTWVYGNSGTGMGAYLGDDDTFSGINIHSDKGSSEGCITAETQADIDGLIVGLSGLDGSAVHPDGRQLYDLYIVQVVSL